MRQVNQATFGDPCCGQPNRSFFGDRRQPAARQERPNGEIVFDPHVAGCCVISLDESQAATVRDTLTEWLG